MTGYLGQNPGPCGGGPFGRAFGGGGPEPKPVGLWMCPEVYSGRNMSLLKCHCWIVFAQNHYCYVKTTLT